MITENFREKFKKNLGDKFNYSPQVKIILDQKGVRNRDGKPYSSQSIRNVFNSIRENDAVEIAIIECYNKAMQEKKKLKSLSTSFKNE